MIKSIQHFQTEGVKNLEKVFVNYSGDMTKMAEMVYGVKENVIGLGLAMIVEELEFYDEWLRTSSKRQEGWHIVRRDERTLLTSMGSITYRRTLFKDKETGKCEYLLDRAMGLEKHTRMTEDAEAEVLREAAESSYRKGGWHASLGLEEVSKETVMNKVHRLEFPAAEPAAEKKAVPYLYVDADEDHVSLQYMGRKGDIPKRKKGTACTVMPKLVYLYEGVTDRGGRKELQNVKYFGGLYEGRGGNEALWEEVNDYIEASYDTESLKGVYVGGDGAAWIKAGASLAIKGKFVLDRFHMHRHVMEATSHLGEGKEDARGSLYRAIHKKKKRLAAEAFDRILAETEGESRREAVEGAKSYILSNWAGIMRQTGEGVPGCSAEGHVSHVYADRMSSRPLGWSRTGADRMARLRVYRANGGGMLELVRWQKKEKAAGAEDVIYSSHDMFRMEEMNRERLGDLAGLHVYSIPFAKVKKIAALRSRVFGL